MKKKKFKEKKKRKGKRRESRRFSFGLPGLQVIENRKPRR